MYRRAVRADDIGAAGGLLLIIAFAFAYLRWMLDGHLLLGVAITAGFAILLAAWWVNHGPTDDE